MTKRKIKNVAKKIKPKLTPKSKAKSEPEIKLENPELKVFLPETFLPMIKNLDKKLISTIDNFFKNHKDLKNLSREIKLSLMYSVTTSVLVGTVATVLRGSSEEYGYDKQYCLFMHVSALESVLGVKYGTTSAVNQ